jgi:hypothetical protein
MLKKITLSILIVLQMITLNCSTNKAVGDILSLMHNAAKEYNLLAVKNAGASKNLLQSSFIYTNTLLVYFSAPLHYLFRNWEAAKAPDLNNEAKIIGQMMQESFILPVVGAVVLFCTCYCIAKKVIHLLKSC